jgi:hypothetical protein
VADYDLWDWSTEKVRERAQELVGQIIGIAVGGTISPRGTSFGEFMRLARVKSSSLDATGGCWFEVEWLNPDDFHRPSQVSSDVVIGLALPAAEA